MSKPRRKYETNKVREKYGRMKIETNGGDGRERGK